MTIKELRKLKPGTRVNWQRGEEKDQGIVRVAKESNPKSARWIEWPDGQRTEDYDDWALENVTP